MSSRVRMGFVVALAAAGVGISAPAAAAPSPGINDLASKVTGTTIAANQTVKTGKALKTSKGPDATDRTWWTFELSRLDTSKVELRVKRPEEEPCLVTPTKLDCPCGWRVATGYEIDQPFELRPVGDATGDAGTLTVSVWHDPHYATRTRPTTPRPFRSGSPPTAART